MNPYHDANAPPSYTDQHGQPLPPYASSYGEKNPQGPGYQSLPQGLLYPQPTPPYPLSGPLHPQPGQEGPPYSQPGPLYPHPGQSGPLYPQPGHPGPPYSQPGPPYSHPGHPNPQTGQLGPAYSQPAAPLRPPQGQMSSVKPNAVQLPRPPPPTNTSAGQQTTQVVRNRTFGIKSTRMECPGCHENIKTRVVKENTKKTHLSAILLCLFCCWPCVCVPYCMASCRDISHRCPKCKQFIGMYRA